RRAIGVKKPLFPRYLFVRVVPPQTWAGIDRIKGVSGLVRFGEDPVAIPDDVIGEIMARCDAEGLMPPPPDRPARAFGPGDRIEVVDGLLVGFAGVVRWLDRHGRIAAWLDANGGRIAATLPATMVVRA